MQTSSFMQKSGFLAITSEPEMLDGQSKSLKTRIYTT